MYEDTGRGESVYVGERVESEQSTSSKQDSSDQSAQVLPLKAFSRSFMPSRKTLGSIRTFFKDLEFSPARALRDFELCTFRLLQEILLTTMLVHKSNTILLIHLSRQYWILLLTAIVQTEPRQRQAVCMQSV